MARLSVIVPFYNEAKNAPLILDQFERFTATYDFELVCVNGGSQDDTEETISTLLRDARYPFAKFISYSINKGYGHALMTGVRAAAGDVIVWTHSDLQTPVADVFRAYDVYQQQINERTVVKGWRTSRSLSQVALSYGMATIASIVLRRRLVEINAQPKLFPRAIVPLLTKAPTDFSLDLYLLCVAQDHGYAIKSIKVRFPHRVHGQSSWAFSWHSRWKNDIEIAPVHLAFASPLGGSTIPLNTAKMTSRQAFELFALPTASTDSLCGSRRLDTTGSHRGMICNRGFL